MRSLRHSTVFWLGLFGLSFLLFLWVYTLRDGVYARFPWSWDMGVVAIVEGEVAVVRLEGGKYPGLMKMPALGRDWRTVVFLNRPSRFFFSLPVSLFVLGYVTVWACLCGRWLTRWKERGRLLGLE
jgi:hypothetical protein